MAIQWFYQTSEGQQSPPVDSTELRRLVEAGIVSPDTLVRQGGGPWESARNLRGWGTSHTDRPASEANKQKERKHMSKAQGIAIIVGIVLIFGMVVFPPWRVETGKNFQRYGGHSPSNVVCGGYAPLFAPPHRATGIDVSRLLLQWVLVGTATAGVVVGIRVWSDPRR